MIDIQSTLAHLLSHVAETEVLEFKEAKNDYSFKKMGQYFSALANEANLQEREEAWLVFGVKDSDKSIVNTRYRSNPVKLDRLKSEIADKTTNRITFKAIHEVETPDGRVILFQIPAAPRGFRWPGKGTTMAGMVNPWLLLIWRNWNGYVIKAKARIGVKRYVSRQI